MMEVYFVNFKLKISLLQDPNRKKKLGDKVKRVKKSKEEKPKEDKSEEEKHKDEKPKEIIKKKHKKIDTSIGMN